MNKARTGFSFSTLEKVIETHGIESTNEFLEQCLLLKNTDILSERPVYKAIILSVCQEFEIAPEQLLKSSNRGVIQKAKQICACLFHFEYEFTIRGISRHVFKKEFHYFIQAGIKTHKVLIDVNNKTDKANMYKERYNRVKDNVKKMLVVKKSANLIDDYN